MSQSYDIEPWMPAISPGAPVPAPKYVPFKYSKMTPGNYYSHDLGFRGSKVAPGTLDNVYNSGLNVKIQGVENKWFRPTAWNNEVSKTQLGDFNNNRKLMQRIGADSVAYEAAGRNARKAAHTKTTVLPQGARSTSSKSPTVIYKGPKDMFYKPGPDFIKSNVKPSTGGFSEMSGNLRPKRIPSGSINPKRIVGHFPAGSDKLMTKPGMITGKMPMVRGFGGGLAGMFSLPPLNYSMPHETHDIFGQPLDQGAGFEPEMIPSPDEYGYAIEPLEYPDQGGTAPSTYGPKMVPNPRAGKARNPYGEI